MISATTEWVQAADLELTGWLVLPTASNYETQVEEEEACKSHHGPSSCRLLITMKEEYSKITLAHEF
jgi:hypothetical protein